ncbi:cation:proton antiporter [Solimicrobium silvestre]|uniref:Sodium/hydrogen exchanger family n=1 Tax=Solimicrobium silvestre TaxID=2099400 RepID=A0A2S9H2X9_9BURK|nr:cation:proton antiporter [Solimicrobium silvestre]PRC94216.1 Sodium/hydrogen exchanger family [Solimicrobium silvestre]
MTDLFFAAVLVFVCVPTALSRLLRIERIFPLVFLQLVFGLFLSQSGLLGWLKTQHIDFLNGSLGFSLQGLGWLGVVIMIALAGGDSMSGTRNSKAWYFVPISVVGFSVTCTLGGLVGYHLATLYPGVVGSQATPLRSAFALGVTLSVTALPVLIAILRDTGLAASTVGKLAVNCAMLDDIWMWLGIALILSFDSTNGHVVRIFPLLAGYLVLMLLVLRPVLRHRYGSKSATSLNVILVFVSVICFSAMLTDLIGLHPLFGAFIGGAIFPQQVLDQWRESLTSICQVLLLPFYFIMTGMRLQFDISDQAFWLLTTIVTATAVAGKFIGVALAARCSGLPWRESSMLGCLMQCKGLMELIAINIFFDTRLIGPKIYSALAMMALISTLLTVPAMTIISRVRRTATPCPTIDAAKQV